MKRLYLTYLPPITKPINDYSTIIEIFYQPRMHSQKCNVQYTHITGCWSSNEGLPGNLE